jgi:hypothetical protein
VEMTEDLPGILLAVGTFLFIGVEFDRFIRGTS